MRFHPRWGNFDYSVIKLYDINREKSYQITSKTKYFSPDISNDVLKLVVVEASVSQNYTLKILDAKSGRVSKTLPNPANWFYTYPKWSTDDLNIISGVTAG